MAMWAENILQRTPRTRNGPSSHGSISSLGESPGQRFASCPQSPPPSAAQPEPDGGTSWLRRKTRQRSGLGRLTPRGKQAQQTLTTPAQLRVCACAYTRVLPADAGTHVQPWSACVHTDVPNQCLASEGQAGYWKCVLIL